MTYTEYTIYYIQFMFIYTYIYRAAATLLLRIVQKITFIHLRVLRRFINTQHLRSLQNEHGCSFPEVLDNHVPDLRK